MDFEEYVRQGEPEKKEKGYVWQMAIGLQQVDGLKPSSYLIETAKQNIEGDITFEEVKHRIDNYYIAKPVKDAADRTEEADKVSARIAEILSERTFTFSPAEYITIHKRLFEGIYHFAGKIRDYNISNVEWALNGESVYYASADSIRATLDYDFEQERKFNYQDINLSQTVQHITIFYQAYGRFMHLARAIQEPLPCLPLNICGHLVSVSVTTCLPSIRGTSETRLFEPITMT